MALNIRNAFDVAFSLSPIVLTGGIAQDIPGNALPIAVFTEGLSIVNGELNGKINGSTKFIPMAGTTLVQQDIANYNFFNQITAANAVIKKPNRVVMQMISPANTTTNKYARKAITFGSLKVALDTHNQSGGSYTVLTPSHIYTGCLMRSFVDSSTLSSDNAQAQHTWMLEFEQPVLTTTELGQTVNNILAKFGAQIPASNVAWSGLRNAVGNGVSNIFG